MHSRTILALRAGLAALLLGLLFAQVLVLPLLSAEAAREFPEVAYLRVPYLVAAIVVVACVQAAVVNVWRLLGLVRAGSIFSPRAFRWVDQIIGFTVGATVIVLAMNVHLTVIEANPPATFLFLTGATVGGICLALLMVVMRALLVRATQLEADMQEVI